MKQINILLIVENFSTAHFFPTLWRKYVPINLRRTHLYLHVNLKRCTKLTGYK